MVDETKPSVLLHAGLFHFICLSKVSHWLRPGALSVCALAQISQYTDCIILYLPWLLHLSADMLNRRQHVIPYFIKSPAIMVKKV